MLFHSLDLNPSELMKMPNDNGTTPKLLLDALNKVMYDDTVEGSDSSDSSLDNAQKVGKQDRKGFRTLSPS